MFRCQHTLIIKFIAPTKPNVICQQLQAKNQPNQPTLQPEKAANTLRRVFLSFHCSRVSSREKQKSEQVVNYFFDFLFFISLLEGDFDRFTAFFSII